MALTIGVHIRVGIGLVNIDITTEPPPMSETNLRNYGLSSADIDARLNYHAFTARTTGKEIDIRGNEQPTEASSAAQTELTDVLDNSILIDKLSD